MFSEIAKRFQGEMAVYHPYATITERKAWEGLDRQWREETLRLGEEYLGFEWPYLTATEFMDFCRTGTDPGMRTAIFPSAGHWQPWCWQSAWRIRGVLWMTL